MNKNYSEIVCTLDPREVLTVKTEQKVDLIDAILDTWRAQGDPQSLVLVKRDFNRVDLIVATDRPLDQAAADDCMRPLSEKYAVKSLHLNLSSVTSQRMQEVGGPQPAAPAPQPTKPAEQPDEPAVPAEEQADPYDAILSLVGMDAFKAWAGEIHAMAERLAGQPVLRDALFSVSYLVAINPGNGCTTLARRMGALLLPHLNKKQTAVREYRLDPDRERGNLDRVQGEIADLKDNDRLYLMVLHLDRMLTELRSERWIEFLKVCWEHNRQAIFLFAVPYLEDLQLRQVQKSIDDLLTVRLIKIQPFSNDDYLCLLEKQLSAYGITVDTAAHDPLLHKIAQEKSDGRFYGVNTLHKIGEEVLYAKLSGGGDPTRLTAEDVRAVLEDENADKVGGYEQLQQLVALTEVKNRIREMVAALKLHQTADAAHAPAMHMMFSGAPGTGKTAVARILGKIFKEEGLLAKGDLYEVSRKDLVGEYIGHTAPKTAEVCRAAYDSVLFIDEAYLLDGGGDKDYGKEAIGTLIAEMENNRHRLVVVFAGYSDQLEKLFDLNPGLRDRIPHHLHFPNYSRDELREIFFVQLGDRFAFDDAFRARVAAYFAELPDAVLQNEHFSNARFVRNLLERVISKAALRTQMAEGGSGPVVLGEGDFSLAVADAEFRKLNEKGPKRPLGFAG